MKDAANFARNLAPHAYVLREALDRHLEVRLIRIPQDSTNQGALVCRRRRRVPSQRHVRIIRNFLESSNAPIPRRIVVALIFLDVFIGARRDVEQRGREAKASVDWQSFCLLLAQLDEGPKKPKFFSFWGKVKKNLNFPFMSPSRTFEKL